MSRHAKKQKPFIRLGAVALTALLMASSITGTQADTQLEAIDLGSASSFAVLAGTGITNTGATTITGTGADMGSHPTVSFTGHETVSVPLGATKYLVADPATETAKADLALGYAAALSLTNSTPITSGAQTVSPGLYKSTATFALAASEVLTLDANGDPSAIFIFQIGSDLSLAASSKVILAGGAQANNVFWQVTTSATFAANAQFAGRLMAHTTITVAAGASFEGQLLAMGGAVTLDSNSILNNSNTSAPLATSSLSPTGPTTIGSSLENAIKFSGEPLPTLTHAWEFSENGTSSWSNVAGASSSSFTITNSQVGGYLRTVATATNSAGELTQTSAATTQVLPPAPATPALTVASDTGVSSSDGITSDTLPTLSLTGLVIGAEVIVTATKAELQVSCSFEAIAISQSCTFTEPLSDGTWLLSAINALAGFPSSESGSLSITIDQNLEDEAAKVLFVSSSTSDGLKIQGDEIFIEIRFSKTVLVVGSPTITLETGATDQVVDYVSGSGTNTLVFVYQVQPGDTSNDLDYVAQDSLGLNGGTILDAAGNAVILTLKEPGEAGSLSAKKDFVVDGNLLSLALSPVSETASSSAVSWLLEAPAALDCSSLSMQDGVDFNFVGLSSMDSITASADETSCTIHATSEVLAAQFGTSSLEIASGFSIADSIGHQQDIVTESDTEIFVDVEPDSSGLGAVTLETISGEVAAEYDLALDLALLTGASIANLESLLAIGMVNAIAAAPSEIIQIDQSEITDPTHDLMSMSFHNILAGEAISLELEVSSEISADQGLEAYMQTENDWTFAGETQLEETVAKTNEFTFTEPGTYVIRLYLVPDTNEIVSQSLRFGLLGSFGTPVISTTGILEQDLPDVNQGHEAHIIVSDSVTTVTPTTPEPESGTDEPAPGVPSQPAPIVPEEPTVEEPVVEEPVIEEPATEETVPEETVPEETVPEEESAGAVTETDTGGQLPDTGASGWLIPLGIGAGLLVLGAVVFLTRRRLV